MEKREFKVEYVTPERAKELLGRNYSGQRKLTAKRREYARLMANGLWDETACPPLKARGGGRGERGAAGVVLPDAGGAGRVSWDATEGNAKRALLQLAALARLRPDGVWRIWE